MSATVEEEGPALLPLEEATIRMLAEEVGIDEPSYVLEGERRTAFLEIAMGALEHRDWQLLRAALEHDTLQAAAGAAGLHPPSRLDEALHKDSKKRKSIASKLKKALASSPRWGELNSLDQVGMATELASASGRQNYMGDGSWFAPAFVYGELRAETWCALAVLAVLADAADGAGRLSASTAHQILRPQVASSTLTPLRYMGYIEYDGVSIRIVRTPHGPWKDAK